MKNKELVLSPSAINLFIEEPALWVLRYFYKVYGGTNIYAVRGKIVEEVINLSLSRDIISFKEFLPHAIEKTLFDDVEIKLKDYKDFYDWGCKLKPVLDAYEIISQQDRIEGELFGVKVAGYIDYLVEGDPTERGNFYLDLKTSAKVPNVLVRGERAGMLPSIKAANVRQQIIYSELSGIDTALLFANEEGDTLHYDIQQQDYDEQLPIIEEAIKKIKKLLTMDLKDVIIDIQPKKSSTGKSMNSFFWDNQLRAEAKKIWQ
jgi:hypothetical protein